jgi:hypothetical protein
MNKKFTDNPEQYLHFVLGENKVCNPDFEYIIHLVEPRCFIKYSVRLAMFASFEDFYGHIADVQWLDGKPSEIEQQEMLIKAWNYLGIEEQILEDQENENEY